MWGLGVLVHLVAVVHRSSLGVAGLDAARRFHLGSCALSAFPVVQVVACAGLQIPAGAAVARFGAKRVLSLGLLLLTAGQLGFGCAHGYLPALAARAVLGCGDAMTFVGVLRLGARRLPVRRGPLTAQSTALFGMAGSLVSTLLLSRLLGSAGWTATFTGTALAGAAVLVLVLLLPRDHPAALAPAPPERGPRDRGPGSDSDRDRVRGRLSAAWREPGTRLGTWVHFTAQFPAMVFLLLWGLPFLVQEEGLSQAAAGELLTVVVLSTVLLGLVYGQVVARHHGARLPLALGTVAATATVWAAVLARSGPAPLWLLVLLCAVLGGCGPASMIGFDLARPANPPERFGTAFGVVTMGGFTASVTALLAIGALLDATGGDYRVALCSVFVLQAAGLTQILRLRRAAARRERERVPVSRVHAVHTATARA
ncbi:MFS transporter [Streptantibioticus silvisoli]|uniref:MFS transporter n=1 Tax=Streptantibioticus silvisoli TaxID=2705255 RepID=A0ABT6W0J9_9ACTN|nr:MFS transporter [Streptantibioticus silvisoli]MDI5964271.1 MFS transporter [Streptantibioticus silvisoli]